MFILASEKTNKRNIRLEGRPLSTGWLGSADGSPVRVRRIPFWMAIGRTAFPSFRAEDRKVEVGRGLAQLR